MKKIEFGDVRIPTRLWARIVTSDSCWDWTGTKDGSGYGRIRFKGKFIGVHRLVLQCLGVPITGLLVMHSCDRPACVNPNHLSAGTASDNQSDSVAKKRHASSRRTECPAGHPYAEFGVVRAGKRYCKPCQSVTSIRCQKKRRDAQVAT